MCADAFTHSPSHFFFIYWSACVLLKSMAGEKVAHTAMHCVEKDCAWPRQPPVLE